MRNMTGIEIRLSVQQNCWLASEYVNGKPNQELIKYFGTHQIPTSFTPTCPLDTVIAELTRLNPGAVIKVGV